MGLSRGTGKENETSIIGYIGVRYIYIYTVYDRTGCRV